MRTFKITAPTSRKVAERRTCFWKTWWVFCLAIAMMRMIERNRALPTLRYVTMLALSARAIHPVISYRRGGVRAYLSGPRLLSNMIALLSAARSQRPESPARMSAWAFIRTPSQPRYGRGHGRRESPRAGNQPRGLGPAVEDRRSTRRVRRGSLRLPRVRLRQGRPSGAHHEGVGVHPWPQRYRGPGRHPASPAEYSAGRVLGGPARDVQLPADVAVRRRGDDDDGAVAAVHVTAKPTACADRPDLPQVPDRDPGRPDRQRQLLLPGGQGPPPRRPQLND